MCARACKNDLSMYKYKIQNYIYKTIWKSTLWDTTLI